MSRATRAREVTPVTPRRPVSPANERFVVTITRRNGETLVWCRDRARNLGYWGPVGDPCACRWFEPANAQKAARTLFGRVQALSVLRAVVPQ